MDPDLNLVPVYDKRGNPCLLKLKKRVVNSLAQKHKDDNDEGEKLQKAIEKATVKCQACKRPLVISDVKGKYTCALCQYKALGVAPRLEAREAKITKE